MSMLQTPRIPAISAAPVETDAEMPSLVSIVEDDADVAQLIMHGLQPLAVEVECFSNLHSFMERLRIRQSVMDASCSTYFCRTETD